MSTARDSGRTLLLMNGGTGNSQVETAVRRARQAAARDLISVLLEGECIDRAIVATDDRGWEAMLHGLPVQVDLDRPGEPFHFGERLAELIRRYQVEQALYAGCGAAPLMTQAAWLEALDSLGAGSQAAATNNLHSSDWIAFRPVPALLPLIESQNRDNGLAWSLATEARLPIHALPFSAASRFDLDTPADLLIARVHPGVGTHLRAALIGLDWPGDALDAVIQVMTREGGHLTVVGRSCAAAWGALEQVTRCWVRLFVEERGMIASGRLAGGQVRSLLSDYLERTGHGGFFAALASLSQAVLMDSRVILAARGLWPSAADRFNADLLRWQEVEDPFLRAFSRAASEADVPIVMGGQSVVSGGMAALLDIIEFRSEESGR
jgi:CTP:molybdopterin cytidylyltransferase MocA